MACQEERVRCTGLGLSATMREYKATYVVRGYVRRCILLRENCSINLVILIDVSESFRGICWLVDAKSRLELLNGIFSEKRCA
jgi:hypothetical protein